MKVEPKFLLVTIERVAQPDPRHHGKHAISVIQPPIARMYPLFAIQLAREQNGDRLEIIDGGLVLTCREHFADTVEAIETAAASGQFVAKPMQRAAIEHAAAVSVGRIEPGGLSVIGGAGAARAPKPPQMGDLRATEWPSDGKPLWMVEHYAKDEDGDYEWTRNGVMPELRARYFSKDEALEAIRVAGYSRRVYSA